MPQRLPKYCVEDVDRHGNIRLYFKKRGCKKVRLTGTPWTPEFMTQYEEAVRDAAPAGPRQEAIAPGSLKWLFEAYYKSAAFKGLDARTQRVRRGILDKVAVKAGHLPFGRLEAKNIRKWRDARAETPEAANGLVKAIRQVFGWAVEAEEADRNPAKDVAYLKSGSEGFHSWTLEEVERFEQAHPIGTRARLAMALLLYTGQRRSDIVVFGRQHVKDGWIKFTQQKNKNRKPVTLEIPVVPELRQIIDASPCGDLTFLVTEFGKPFTSNGFGNRMRKWCDEAGLLHCAAHGLRKAAAARLAERGRSTREIMAVTGHRTSKEVDRYTRGAEQKRLAARAMGVEPESHRASPTSEKPILINSL